MSKQLGVIWGYLSHYKYLICLLYTSDAADEL